MQDGEHPGAAPLTLVLNGVRYRLGSGVDRVTRWAVDHEQQRRCRDHAVHIGAVFDISITAGNGITEQPEI